MCTLRKKHLLQTYLAVERIVEIRQKASERETKRNQYLAEFEDASSLVESACLGFLTEQIKTLSDDFSGFEDVHTPIDSIYDQKRWDRGLVDVLFPVFAKIVGKSAFSELERLGVDLAVMKKAITPSDWLDDSGDSDLGETTLTVGASEIAMGFLREYPLWMQEAIRKFLEETFSQEYWTDINKTTLDEIRRVIEEGIIAGKSIEEISSELRDLLEGSAAYVKSRSKLIARTETGHALNAARSMSMDAVIAEAGPEALLKKQWLSVLGPTTRDTHANADGVPENEEGMWYIGGYWCRWPGDYRLPARERCNCFPSDTLVSGSFTGAQKVWYEGVVTKIVTAGGSTLSVTPNHPIMTSRGWVFARELKPHDKVATYCLQRDSVSESPTGENISDVRRWGSNQINDEPISIEEVFQAIFSGSRVSGAIEIRRPQMDDFYGDGEFIQGDIEVVRADWGLLGDFVSNGLKKEGNFIFSLMDPLLTNKFSQSSCRLGFNGVSLPSSSDVSRIQPGEDCFRSIGSISPSGALAVGLASNLDAHLLKVASENCSIDSSLFFEALHRNPRSIKISKFLDIWNSHSFRSLSSFSGSNENFVFNESRSTDVHTDSELLRDSRQIQSRRIKFDEVVDVSFNSFVGHVYDLQSSEGMIVARNPGTCNTGIITSNCQCTLVMAFGLTDQEARDLIESYSERIGKKKSLSEVSLS